MRLLTTICLFAGLCTLPLAADSTPLREINLQIEAGQLRNVEIRLDSVLPSKVPYRVKVTGPVGRDDLRVGFAVPDAPLRDLRASDDFERGSPLLLRILAERCCRKGLYESAVLVQPYIAGRLGTPIRIPIQIQVAEAQGPLACRGRVQRTLSRSAAAGIAALYLFGWIANSQFLSRRDLALRLRPLRWDGAGRAVEHSVQDVDRLVRRDLSFRKRALAWLAANPLVFGFPGGTYHETVELQLEPKLDVYASRLVLAGERNLPLRLKASPDLRRGLFATALGGMHFFTVAVRGQIGVLTLEGTSPTATGEPLFSWLSGSRTLIHRRETENKEAPIGPAGWRI